ncbi:MAG TPA: LPO_1073/Vpar_1526 family protein [Solirubrobacterales bacterium]|nr:LPO_1073/Vpar_1526 family protein [Solirubrobacterales bacterium]
MKQHQESDGSATNVQAGGDIVISKGLSAIEVREIALDVFHRNFLELRGVAEDVARGRAEKITGDFLAQLEARTPEALPNVADPDVQRSVFNAQREYACSGDEDLESALVDLLVDRVSRENRDTQTLALNEAINAAPKLTIEQRQAIAVCFIVRYTRFTGDPTLEGFFETYIKGNLLPLASGIPTSQTAYQHIEYVGAGTVGMGQVRAAKAIMHGSEGWFNKGFKRDDVPETLASVADDGRVFKPCLRDKCRLQLSAMHPSDMAALAELAGGTELESDLKRLLDTGAMSESEVHEDLLHRVPEAQEFVNAWDGSALRHLTLTSVGLAIGYGYWRRTTGNNTPLSTWIED